MAVAQLSDTHLSYWEVGRGRRCLVMHGGLGIDHSAYRPGLDVLGEALRLVYYDHRCHGRSGRPPLSTLTLARLADDADDLRSHLGEQRIGVLGHSFGGFIAYEFAARYPDRLAFLIIVCSSPSVDYSKEVAQIVEARATPAMREVLALPPPTTSAEWAERNSVLLPLYFHHWDPSYGRALTERVTHNYEAAVAPGIDLSGWDRWHSLASIEVPTLIVVGRHDFIPHLPRAERAAKLIPKATLVVMENSGHYPWLEEPDAFASVVRQWLSSNS
jgi:proline iminopeptidase